MSEWNSGTFNPGQVADWIQGFVNQVTGNLRGMVGFPKQELVRHMDDFALRSVKRHLEARQADIADMMSVIDQELARRAEKAQATPPDPASGSSE
ncbi:MAG: hypothetical protein M0Z36_03700 [Thermaerobacter sp.]|nr:hypothetical protein [Thermaerobacter sp.]